MSLACLASTASTAPNTILQGVVADSEGAAVRMAYIVVHEDGSGKGTREAGADIKLRSDEGGRFSAQLEPGFYDVCVMAQAFTPDCRKVLMKEAQTASVTVRLKIDPEVIRQLGDRF